ncbi:MAG: hypothetical protein ACFFCD_13830 [Promethearchaeota archaeon]
MTAKSSIWSRNGVRIPLLIVDSFVAVTAAGGGVALAAGLEDFPLDWLSGTPFNDYFIPGLLLTILVGGSATVSTIILLRIPEIGIRASMLAGLIMMEWIVVEVTILNQPSPNLIEVFYFALGLIMAVLALILLIQNRTKKATSN